MQNRGETPGFGPVCAPEATALVLGSYPSPKSFGAGFYYGHPQNRFWPVLAALAGLPPPAPQAEARREFILRCGLALWDVLERCAITGAADASITHPVPNDVAALVRRAGITAVYCNGGTAYRLYEKHCRPHTGLPAVQLPSTSPANAAWGLPRLIEAWQPLAAHMAVGR